MAKYFEGIDLVDNFLDSDRALGGFNTQGIFLFNKGY